MAPRGGGPMPGGAGQVFWRGAGALSPPARWSGWPSRGVRWGEARVPGPLQSCARLGGRACDEGAVAEAEAADAAAADTGDVGAVVDAADAAEVDGDGKPSASASGPGGPATGRGRSPGLVAGGSDGGAGPGPIGASGRPSPEEADGVVLPMMGGRGGGRGRRGVELRAGDGCGPPGPGLRIHVGGRPLPW